jgi:hypothetical protein
MVWNDIVNLNLVLPMCGPVLSTFAFLLNSHNNPMKQILLFLRGAHNGTERLSNLPKITQARSDQTKLWIQVVWLQDMQQADSKMTSQDLYILENMWHLEWLLTNRMVQRWRHGMPLPYLRCIRSWFASCWETLSFAFLDGALRQSQLPCWRDPCGPEDAANQ